MGNLENLFPDDMKKRGRWFGNEVALSYEDALEAISIASEHGIAVLGLEAFEMQKEGLFTVGLADPSTSIRFSGNWNAYVATMNAESKRWIEEHPFGDGHGYTLTSASETEFAALRNSPL